MGNLNAQFYCNEGKELSTRYGIKYEVRGTKYEVKKVCLRFVLRT
jgi:hypothetical protein